MARYKNYLSVNIISFIGYIFFIYLLIAVFIIYPQVNNYDIVENNARPYALYGFLIQASYIIFITGCIELILILLIFLEFLIYKIKVFSKYAVNVSGKYEKVYSVILHLGLIFSIIPVLVETYCTLGWVFK